MIIVCLCSKHFSSKGKGKQSSIKVLQEVRRKREIKKRYLISVSPQQFLVHQFQILTQSERHFPPSLSEVREVAADHLDSQS